LHVRGRTHFKFTMMQNPYSILSWHLFRSRLTFSFRISSRRTYDLECRDTMPSIRTALGFHWPQFVTANENWLFATVQEGRNREAHLNTGDIQMYFNARRTVCGAFVASALTRSSRCLNLPNEVLAQPVVQGMEHAIMDVMITTNVRGNSFYQTFITFVPLGCLLLSQGTQG
jgi:hypothetical protein